MPVLWRPLHEAGGKWFWWGAKGADSAKKLYSIMRDRLINHHGLNNLIRVWSSPEADWYPGNDKVDILGYDSYPGAYDYQCPTAIYNQIHSFSGGEKMIALCENGPLPNFDQCFREGAKFIYFLSWSDLLTQQNDQQHIKDVYYNSIVQSF